MKPFQFASRASLGIIVLLVANSWASAQATRTWVSGVGDDVNPCSRTAPCKTFAGAISKTADGGEINCIDSGGFGAVTTTKSITIDGAGVHASILASLTNGVIINDASPAGSVVTLRNLSINGNGNGLDAIRFISGETLNVENCVIFGFTGQGIDGALGGTSVGRVNVTDSIFRKCALGAIQLTPVLANTSTINAVLDNVRMEGNSFGLQANNRVKATLRNCSMSNNTSQGMLAFSNGAGNIDVTLEECTLAGNGSIGIRANAAIANVRMSNTMITNNTGAGFDLGGGGILSSFGNNRLVNNGANVGSITLLAPAQQ